MEATSGAPTVRYIGGLPRSGKRLHRAGLHMPTDIAAVENQERKVDMPDGKLNFEEISKLLDQPAVYLHPSVRMALLRMLGYISFLSDRTVWLETQLEFLKGRQLGAQEGLAKPAAALCEAPLVGEAGATPACPAPAGALSAAASTPTTSSLPAARASEASAIRK